MAPADWPKPCRWTFARCKPQVKRRIVRAKWPRDSATTGKFLLGSWFLLEHALHDFNLCALGVVDIGGEVEQHAVLPGAGGGGGGRRRGERAGGRRERPGQK